MQRSGTDLDFDCAEVLTHIVGRSLGTRGKPRGLLLLFNAQRCLCAREVVALELTEEREDLVVGEQRRALIEDLEGSETLIPILITKGFSVANLHILKTRKGSRGPFE